MSEDATSTPPKALFTKLEYTVFQHMFYEALQNIAEDRDTAHWENECHLSSRMPFNYEIGEPLSDSDKADLAAYQDDYKACMTRINRTYDAKIDTLYDQFIRNKDLLCEQFLRENPGSKEYFEACAALSVAKAAQDEAYDKYNQAFQDELSGTVLAPGAKALLERNYMAAIKATEEARLNTLSKEERDYIAIYDVKKDAQHVANLAEEHAKCLAHTARMCSMEDEVRAIACSKVASEAAEVAVEARKIAEVLSLVFKNMYLSEPEPEPEPEPVLILAIPPKIVRKFIPVETPPADWSCNGVFWDESGFEAAKQGLSISIS